MASPPSATGSSTQKTTTDAAIPKPPTFRAQKKSRISGTKHIQFFCHADKDPCTLSDLFYQSISCAPAFSDYSLEEFRVQDYIIDGKNIVPCKQMEAATNSQTDDSSRTSRRSKEKQRDSSEQVVQPPHEQSEPPSPEESLGQSTSIAPKEDWEKRELLTPHGSVYYTNPNLCVVTDLDISDELNLAVVIARLNALQHIREGLEIPEGWELWLRNTAPPGEQVALQDCWVDHNAAQIHISEDAPFLDLPLDGETGNPVSNDQSSDLEKEGRYWEFVETHPAHVQLPPNVPVMVTNILTSTYTDLVLFPLYQPRPPFTKTECWELLQLFRAFKGSREIQTYYTLTRAIAQVMVRYTAWRQE
ncbi:hypothetical protein K474DRAFT_1662335 [Panus rudis PR-1116 ss-1]|nr:hypothetical protein K474DRAFT_1662335 [Panus rudis PR-1116 ss-1]